MNVLYALFTLYFVLLVLITIFHVESYINYTYSYNVFDMENTRNCVEKANKYFARKMSKCNKKKKTTSCKNDLYREVTYRMFEC